jgi:hypothetical protein
MQSTSWCHLVGDLVLFNITYTTLRIYQSCGCGVPMNNKNQNAPNSETNERNSMYVAIVQLPYIMSSLWLRNVDLTCFDFWPAVK